MTSDERGNDKPKPLLVLVYLGDSVHTQLHPTPCPAQLMTRRSAPVRQQSEEAYPLADLALSSSLSPTPMDVNHTRHAAFDQRAAATRRMPAEDYGEEDVDAFIAENQGFRHGPGGMYSGSA